MFFIKLQKLTKIIVSIFLVSNLFFLSAFAQNSSNSTEELSQKTDEISQETQEGYLIPPVSAVKKEGVDSESAQPLSEPETFQPLSQQDEDFAQEVIELTNKARWDNGQLPPYKRQENLMNASMWYAQWMADNNHFAHTEPNGRTASQRATAFGYNWNSSGENIAGGQSSPSAAVTSWMGSTQGHRESILSTNFREIGTGYRFNQNYTPIIEGVPINLKRAWVQNFGRRNNVDPVVINREAKQSNTKNVNLYVYGQGFATQMRFRNENGAWSNWENYNPNKSWELSPDNGTKTVNAEIRNAAGTVRSNSDTIILEEIIPNAFNITGIENGKDYYSIKVGTENGQTSTVCFVDVKFTFNQNLSSNDKIEILPKGQTMNGSYSASTEKPARIVVEPGSNIEVFLKATKGGQVFESNKYKVNCKRYVDFNITSPANRAEYQVGQNIQINHTVNDPDNFVQSINYNYTNTTTSEQGSINNKLKNDQTVFLTNAKEGVYRLTVNLNYKSGKSDTRLMFPDLEFVVGKPKGLSDFDITNPLNQQAFQDNSNIVLKLKMTKVHVNDIKYIKIYDTNNNLVDTLEGNGAGNTYCKEAYSGIKVMGDAFTCGLYEYKIDPSRIKEGNNKFRVRMFDEKGFVEKEINFTSNTVTPNSFIPHSYLTWNDTTNGNGAWTLIANPSTTSAVRVRIQIGNDVDQIYNIPAGKTITPTFPGLLTGPITVSTENGANVIVTQRTHMYIDSLGRMSFNEYPAILHTSLKTKYYFTWYDATGKTDAWVLVANPSTTEQLKVKITIAGIEKGIYTINPRDKVTPTYKGLANGPVLIESLPNNNGNILPIITTQRVHMNINGRTSFNEYPGLSTDNIKTKLYFTWNDPNNGNTVWNLIGNPDTTKTAKVNIKIAGVNKGNYEIPANGRITPTFAGSTNGPVEINSIPNSNGETIAVFATQRVYQENTFNEFAALNADGLSSKYYFTWSDGTAKNLAWVLVANPSTTTSTQVTIKIAGIQRAQKTLQPGEIWTPSFQGFADGPVDVKSSNGNVITTQRVVMEGAFNEIAGIVQ